VVRRYHQAEKAYMYQVTYFNAQLGKTCVLIDNIDMETALEVLAKFGDKREKFHYMGPQTKIERMGEKVAA
jgi:hypothetical protein